MSPTDWYDAPGADGKGEPDIELALIVHLETQLAKVRADTVTPHDYLDLLEKHEGRGGFLHVRRTGGGASRKTDSPQVSIRAFTLASGEHPRSSHKLLGAVARCVEAINTAGPVQIPQELGGGTVLFDAGEKISGPVQLPWLDDRVLLVESLFAIDARRH